MNWRIKNSKHLKNYLRNRSAFCPSPSPSLFLSLSFVHGFAPVLSPLLLLPPFKTYVFHVLSSSNHISYNNQSSIPNSDSAQPGEWLLSGTRCRWRFSQLCLTKSFCGSSACSWSRGSCLLDRSRGCLDVGSVPTQLFDHVSKPNLWHVQVGIMPFLCDLGLPTSHRNYWHLLTLWKSSGTRYFWFLRT